MGQFYYLPGTKANHLAHTRAVVTPTPAQDSLFPKAHLSDGRVDRFFRFGSTASQYDLAVTLDRILNGNLDTWASGTPTSWTKTIVAGDPTITEEVTLVRSGSAAKYTGDSGDDEAELTQDFDVVAGERLRIDGWMRGDATIPARARLFNRQTGKYLQSNGTWGAAADLFTETPATYANKVLSFAVETFAETQVRDMQLRLRLWATGNGAAYWDDWFVFPRCDLFALFGHNLSRGWTVQIRADAGATLLDTMTVRRQSFFRKLSALENRRDYTIRLIPDTSLANFAPQLTELVIGSAVSLIRKPGVRSDLGRSETWPAINVAGQNGPIGSFRLVDEAHIQPFVLEFMGPRTNLDDFIENVWAFTKGGHEPIVFVPEDTSTDVFLGKLSPELSVNRLLDSVDLWVYSVDFEHLPYGFTL